MVSLFQVLKLRCIENAWVLIGARAGMNLTGEKVYSQVKVKVLVKDYLSIFHFFLFLIVKNNNRI